MIVKLDSEKPPARQPGDLYLPLPRAGVAIVSRFERSFEGQGYNFRMTRIVHARSVLVKPPEGE